LETEIKVKVAILSTLAILLLSGLSAPVLAFQRVPFHLVKVCNLNGGSTCQVTSSSFNGIPVGILINYSGSSYGALVAVINVPYGTATGLCDIADTPPLAGSCTFGSGTGTLTSFHLQVAVTTPCTAAEAAANGGNNNCNWLWNGFYWFE
jgi:hypothetical protein